MRLWATVAAVMLAAFAAMFGVFALLDESCFERLERVQLRGEAYPGELNEIGKSC